MRVLIPSPGAGRTLRGYEIFATELATHLHALDVEVCLLTGGAVDGGPSTRVRSIARSGPIARKASLLARVSPHSVEQYSFAVAAALQVRRFRPDVILASESVLFGIWKHVRTPLHANTTAFVLTNGGSRRPPFRSVDAVIHHSEDLHALASAAEPQRLHVHLPCPIEVPAWEQVVAARAMRSRTRASLGIASDRYVVTAVGAIDTTVKRIDYIAEELAPLATPMNLHLLLLGRPSDQEPNLLGQIESALPGRVTVAEVPATEVGDYYAAADVHVSASLNEGFGRVFVEAQAWGTPNIVHETERTRSILQHEGTFIDMATKGSLSTALRAVDPGDTDPEGPHRCWINAETMGWERLAPAYLETLHEIVRRRRP